jgi:hypothetical protein
MPKIQAVSHAKFPKIRPIRMPLVGQRKRSRLFVKWILEAEKQIPGASGREKKAWVKQRLDDLIQLPPVAEQISDFIISIGVEMAYAGIRTAELDTSCSNCAGVEAELKKLNTKYKSLNTRYKKLKDSK